MTIPPLYAEGLAQHALRGAEQLHGYKLGLIEAILKQALRDEGAEDPEAMRAAMRTAIDVAQWEMRPPRSRDKKLEDLP
jgi:hypothetical protein